MMTHTRRLLVPAALAGLLVPLVPAAAHAFCGFYVSGAGADMFNNATQVVMMRSGTRTVLSMQNNYQGPPENFAMVVPVPVVLQEDNVKTLDRGIFERVDRLAAPRLVEYWEQDPCRPNVPGGAVQFAAGAGGARDLEGAAPTALGVTIEAQFKVGEYEIVILSAQDSTGLDTWLRQQKYTIPEGSEPLLRPYVETGSKFFVAKVDAAKVQFSDGMARLSPLRFHYDSDEFSLPVRLGLINSAGTQDLIVHILAPSQRYEVANYENATIPTNLDVSDDTRERFGEFYAALFDATLEKNRGAVITEYAWDAAGCDPCPTPALNPSELATLGADVLFQPATPPSPGGPRAKKSATAAREAPPLPPPPATASFVLTRLHARYGKEAIGEDLVFKAAPPIVGGREFHGPGGKVERGAQPAPFNAFQARYAIRHPWTGKVECENPQRGLWGGPPDGRGEPQPRPATDLAFAPRGKLKLAGMIMQDVPELGVTATSAPAGKTPVTGKTADQAADRPGPDKKTEKKGCQVGHTRSGGGPGSLALGLLGLGWLAGRRRRRTTRGPGLGS